MKFTQRTRGIAKAIAVVLSLAVPVMFAISAADARPGGGGSSGSRGSRTHTAPPPTATAPNAAQPMNRTFTQPGSPGAAAAAPAAAGAAAKGGFFNRPGMMGGMLGGLAMGFLGAGLFGMLSGGSLFSGLGGIASIIGLLLQIGLVIIVVRLAMKWWQRRNATASAYAAPDAAGAAAGLRPAGELPELERVRPRRIFQRAAGDRSQRLRSLRATARRRSGRMVERGHRQAAHAGDSPEMVSYFTKDIEENKANNDINKVSDVKLLQGDLAESWREGETDYASVAMRFSLVDKTLERGTNRLVAGSETPIEATEVWTFVRPKGAAWELSAIQQT